MTTYTNSKGEALDIPTMEFNHLVSARDKLVREEPDRAVEITAMSAEIVRREAVFAQHRRELEGEGYFSVTAVGGAKADKLGWAICSADGAELADTWATKEAAAWAKAWGVLRGEG